MKKTTILFLVVMLAVAARASLLTLTLTNQFGLPDTNVIRVVQVDTNTPAMQNGNPITIGLPVRVQPTTNGVVTIFRMTGNYSLYGPTLGAGIIYRFPDSSSNTTALPLSGFNTFVTASTVVGSTLPPGTGIATNGGTTHVDGAVVVTNNAPTAALNKISGGYFYDPTFDTRVIVEDDSGTIKATVDNNTHPGFDFYGDLTIHNGSLHGDGSNLTNLQTVYALNAKNFGAVGDGVTDDTVAITNWLFACTTSNVNGYLPAGSYLVKAALTVGIFSDISGNFNSATIVGNGDTSAFLCDTTNKVGLEVYGSWKVKNLLIESKNQDASTNSVGIFLHASHKAEIANCLVRGFSTGIADCDYHGAAGYVFNTLIINNTIQQWTQYAIAITNFTTGNVIGNNYLNNQRPAYGGPSQQAVGGIFLLGHSEGTFYQNNIEWAKLSGNAVNVVECRAMKCQDLHIEGVIFNGTGSDQSVIYNRGSQLDVEDLMMNNCGVTNGANSMSLFTGVNGVDDKGTTSVKNIFQVTFANSGGTPLYLWSMPGIYHGASGVNIMAPQFTNNNINFANGNTLNNIYGNGIGITNLQATNLVGGILVDPVTLDVGLGTLSPLYPLHVVRSGNSTNIQWLETLQNAVEAVDWTGGGSGIKFLNYLTFPGNFTTNLWAGVTGVGESAYSLSTGLAFYTLTSGFDGPPTEKVRIAGSGNVGIGTAIPGSLLHVSGNGPLLGAGQNKSPIWATGGSGFVGTGFWRTDDANGGWLLGTSSDAAGDFGILQNQGAGVPVSRFYISVSGKVGIGTTSPASILDLTSTTSTFLPPRMTTTQRLALTPFEGSTVYDLTLHKLYVYDGTVWQAAW